MYTHRTFWSHPLEDLATKGIPGGGADGNGGFISLHDKRRVSAKSKMTKEDIMDIVAPSEHDEKAAAALSMIAEAQVRVRASHGLRCSQRARARARALSIADGKREAPEARVLRRTQRKESARR